MNEALMKEEGYGKFLNQSSKYAKEIVEKIPPGEDKLKWIVHYVRDNYSWNGYYSLLARSKAKDFVASGSGTSTEINLFLCAVLLEAGFDASPVLISTRNHGKIYTGYPFQDQFNNSIVLVRQDGNLILTDGTEKHIPYNTIPPMCINGQGLIVDKNGDNFINVTGFNNSRTTINFSLKPDVEEGVVKGGIVYQGTGYDAFHMRKKVENNLDDYKVDLKNNGITDLTDINVEMDETDKFEIRYKGHAEMEMLGNELLITPFLHYPPSENLLKSKTRKYPVDMIYNSQNVYLSQVEIPEGYGIEDLPENYEMEDDLMKLRYSCKVLGNYLVFESEATFKKSLYEPSDYSKLRTHYAKMVDLLNEQVILVKK
jgi:hypothetical protein